MLIDKQNEFSDSQAVTATAISTNVINTLAGNSFTNVVQNLGGFAGSCFLIVQVDTAFTAGGAATLTISLESDSTANLATSPTVHYSTAALALAALVPGTIILLPLPFGSYEKYLGVRYTVATGPMTAGAISAFLTRDVQSWKPYAVGNSPNI